MRSLILLSVCISIAAANIFDQYLMNMVTQNMDPLTKRLFQSTIGPELFDMDVGSSRGSRGGGGFPGMSLPSMAGGPSGFDAPMPRYPKPAFSSPSLSNNIVDPSASNPYKLSNPFTSFFGDAGPAPSFGNAGPAPTFGNAGPAPTFGNPGPAPTFGNTGPAPSLGNAGSGRLLLNSPQAVPLSMPSTAGSSFNMMPMISPAMRIPAMSSGGGGGGGFFPWWALNAFDIIDFF